MTFSEFTKRFSTEEQCREYLYSLRFQNGFACPKCGESKAWKIGDVLFECSACGRQTSVIAGTIFQDTRKPLTEWFTAIWWITTQKSGASAKGLQRVLGLRSYQTAWTWLHKIRTAMVFPNRSKLAGTIEVDETYIGSEEHNGSRGRGTENKILVVAAVELGDKGKLGRVRMSVIPNASAESLRQFVTDNIESGSNVITDGWSGYSFLKNDGYMRTIYVQKKADSDDKTLPHIHTIFSYQSQIKRTRRKLRIRTIHAGQHCLQCKERSIYLRLVSLLKRWLLGTHQGAVSEKHMQLYLDEYVFRFNRRKATERGLLFYRLLECAMQVQPTTYADLVSQGEEQF